MNETLKNIYERRSVRKFKKDAISRELVEQIIDAGRMAPSAINRQPWRFYVVTGSETIKLLAHDIIHELKKNPPTFKWVEALKKLGSFTKLVHGIELMIEEDPIFHSAPLVIFITAPRDNEWAELDIGMCTQNMMLAAQSLGINSCPVGLGKYAESAEHGSLLGVTKKEHICLSLVLGYAREIPHPKERNKDNVVFIE